MGMDAYQQNLSSFNTPKTTGFSTSDVYSTIAQRAVYDKQGATNLLNSFHELQNMSGSKYYNPYLGATNKAINNLSQYGIDTSVIDDAFFSRNNYLLGYLSSTGTTNSPTKPGKKASLEQKAAYEYYQIWKSEDKTKQAEREWAALKQELSYWATQKDRNYSDDYIISNINWDKYKTLAEMDSDSRFYSPMELNRVIGYSKENMRGVIWAARNGSTGNAEYDTLMYYGGQGNQWKLDDKIAAKLDSTNRETYSPYSVGSTMDAERLYFGVSEFTDKWIEENRAKYLGGNDETAKKYFNNVQAANDYTKKLEEELKAMREDVQNLLKTYSDPQTIMDLIAAKDEYKDLFDLDKTLETAVLKETTRKVDYRWRDMQLYIQNMCDIKNNAQGINDFLTGIYNMAADYYDHYPKVIADPNPVEITEQQPVASVILPDATPAPPTSDENRPKVKPTPKPEEPKETPAPDLTPRTKEPGVTPTPGPKETQTPSPAETPEATPTSPDVSSTPSASETPTHQAEPTPTPAPKLTEAEIETEKSLKKDMEEIADTVEASGTEAEKIALGSGKTNMFDYAAEKIKSAKGNFAKSFAKTTSTAVISKYWPTYKHVFEHDQKDEHKRSLKLELEKIMPEWEGLNAKYSESESIGGLDSNQYVNLMSLPENPMWESIDIAMQNGPGAYYNSFLSYYQACDEIYNLVTGIHPLESGEDERAVEEKAKLWWNYLKEGGEEHTLMSPEEMSKYKELDQLKNNIEAEIQADDDYLSANEDAYNLAKQDCDHMRLLYEAAAQIAGVDNPELVSKIEAFYSIANTTPDYQVSPYNPYDYEKYTTGNLVNANALAAADAANAKKNLDAINAVLENADEYGINIDNMDNVNANKKIITMQAKDAGYVLLDNIPGFGETAAKGAEKANTSENPVSRFVAGGDLSFMDLVLHGGLSVADSRTQQFIRKRDSAQLMTEEEKNRYFYLLEAEGEEAAEEYFNFLIDPEYGSLFTRQRQKSINDLREFAGQSALSAAAAYGLSFVSKMFSLPSELINGDYSWRDATQAMRSGGREFFVDALGGEENPFASFVGKVLDVGVGILDYKMSSAMVSGFADVLGGVFQSGKVAELVAKIGDKGTMLHSATVAVPMAADGASAKYKSVYDATHDATKAGWAAAIEFSTGLVSHALIARGLHKSYQTHPGDVAGGLAGLIEETLKSAGVIGASSAGENTISALVDKYMLEADGEWGQNYEKYYNLYHSKELAEQMADDEMKNGVINKTCESILNAMLRTAMTTAVREAAGSNTMQAIKDQFAVLKNYYKPVETTPQYVKVGDVASGFNFENVPDEAIINPVNSNGTTMYDRATGKAYNIVAFMQTDSGNIVFISDTGDQIPFMNIATQNGKPASNMTDDEWELLSAGWNYGKDNYNPSDTRFSYGNNTPEATPENTTETGLSITSQNVTTEAPVEPTTYTEPAALPGAFQSSAPVDDSVYQQRAKDLQIIQSAYNAQPEAVAVGVASVLDTGDANMDRAAAQTIVSGLCGNNSKTVSIMMAQLLARSNGVLGEGEVKDLIAKAALSKGLGLEALKRIAAKVQNGKTITVEDVNILKASVEKDENTDPQGFAADVENARKDNIIANETVKKAARAKKNAQAKKKTKTVRRNLNAAKKDAEDAHNKVDAVSQNLIAATQEFIPEDPSAPVNKENAALVEQTRNELEGALTDAQTADNAVTVQQQQLAEAQQEEQAANDAAMDEARREAMTEVAQQEQQAQVEAQANAEPNIIPLQTAQPARLTNGKSIQITGVFANVTAGNYGNLTQPTNGTSVSRERVLDEFDNDTFGVYATPYGYVTDMLLQGRRQTPILNILDQWLEDRPESRRTNPIEPAEWFNHSLRATSASTGDVVDIVGVAGFDGESNETVLMAANGKKYGFSDLAFGEDPFMDKDGEESYFDLTDNIDYNNLPEETNYIGKETENASGGSEETEGSESTDLQAEEAEDNAAELAAEPRLDDGSGDNGDAGAGAGTGEAERGAEGVPAGNGSNQSRVSKRLLSNRNRQRLTNKGATDLNLQSETDQQRFSSALDSAREGNPYKLFVDPQSPEALEEKGAIMLVSEDGLAVGAVGTKGKYKGDIFGVCKSPNSTAKNASKTIVIQGVAQGGNKLDCYNGTRENAGLPKMYSSVGMIPVARVAFATAIADPDWNYDRDDHPDVVFWKHCGDSATTIINKLNKAEDDGGYHLYNLDDIAQLPVFHDGELPGIVDEEGNPLEYGYDFAWRYRDNVLAGKYPDGFQTYPEGAVALTDNTTGKDVAIVGIAPAENGMNYVTLDGETIPAANFEGDNKKNLLFNKWVAENDPAIYNHALYIGDKVLDEWLSSEGFASSNPKYAQAYITTMNPSDFLRLTEAYEDGRNEIISNSEPLDAEKITKDGARVPIKLVIDEESGKIIDHEGRHRSVSLASAGVTKMPVLLFTKGDASKYNKTYHKSMTLKGQDSEKHGIENEEEITFTDVIPLSSGNADLIKKVYATPSAQEAAEQGKYVLQYSKPETITEPPVNSPNNPPTTAPVRIDRVELPDAEKGQRQWGAEGAQEGDLLEQEVKDWVAGHNEYLIDTNQDQLVRAAKWVSEHKSQEDPTGFYNALKEVESDNFNPMSVDGQAIILDLLRRAATNRDTDAEVRLSDLYNKSGTDLGQAMQLRRIFTLMTPEGRKEALKREVKKISDGYQAQGKKVKLEIPKEILEAASKAKSEEEFDEVRRKMEIELATQIPSDWHLRMRTIRMTSMLANPRTHIRNIVGNGFAVPMVETKNILGAAMESMTRVEKGKRTKSIGRTKEAVEFAKRDAEIMLPELQGTAKYYEMSAVERNRKAFGTKNNIISRTIGRAFQKFADTSSNLLETEDAWFLTYHYRRALSGYMTANGLTAEDMTGKTLDEARAYAILEAQKATYRDPNTLARWLSDQRNKPGSVQFVINAVQPFVKTPANIMRRGIEYSPVGFISALTTRGKRLAAYKEWEDSGFKGPRPKNAESASEAIDKLAAGFTGTMIAGLGAWLAAAGVLKVKASEKEKLEGSQDYSLEIDGKSYGIGSVIPFNIPLLLGGSLYNVLSEKDNGKNSNVLSRALNAISEMLEPIVDTTMMTSLNSLLETSRYSSGNLTLSTLAQKVLANYAASYFPSIIGAFTKTVDPTQRKSYTMSGDELNIWTAMIEQVQNKTPYLSTLNVPYINEWGEENKTDVFTAFFRNFILPDKINEIEDSKLNQILEKLENETDNTTMFLDNKAKTLTVNKQTIKLTDKQWYQYHSTKDKAAKSVLQELIERPEFIALSATPEVQAELVKKVYKFAKAYSAKEMFPDKNITDGWTNGAITAYKKGGLVDYIFEKEEESAKKLFVQTQKDTLLETIEKATDGEDVEAIKTSIDYLLQAGTSKDSIKTSITKKFKPLYKEADAEERTRIENILRGIGLGYEKYNFKNWLKDGSSELPEAYGYVGSAGGAPKFSRAPQRPTSERNWGRYMQDLDNYWAKYDFDKNDPTGQYGEGTIDLNNRIVLHNDDGSISSERSFSFYDEDTGKEILIPQIVDGELLTEEEAIDYYYKTVEEGNPEYLGMFDTWQDADEYATMLHNRQNWYINR